MEYEDNQQALHPISNTTSGSALCYNNDHSETNSANAGSAAKLIMRDVCIMLMFYSISETRLELYKQQEQEIHLDYGTYELPTDCKLCNTCQTL